MYFLYLNLVLENLKKAQKTSSVVYKYDKVSKQFHLHLDKKNINRALLYVRIYIFPLLLSFIFGVKKLSILHFALSVAFITTRMDFLISHIFTNSSCGYFMFVISSFRVVSVFLIRYASVHTTIDALGVAVYPFIFGMFGMSNYLNHLLVCSNIRQLILVFKYNQIVLLIAHFNSLFSHSIFIKTITPDLFLPVSCFFVVLKYHGQLHVLSTLIFLSMGFFFFFGLEIVFIMASTLWFRSVKVLQQFNAKLGKEKRQAYLRRILQSQRCLKINIGENNFVEASTPLAYASYNSTQISTLLCARF